jgi:hypothetical protein
VNDSFCDPNRTVLDSDLCWESVNSVDRMNAYRIFVVSTFNEATLNEIILCVPDNIWGAISYSNDCCSAAEYG